ncbi:sensor histidine kinase [Salegentibacter chungangensis]|uniref:Sensor histidine kinase n=1 Tax=Salegentibacter chungangensis TaxID=1335724 RepID=A0ABW3NQ94_9FLAO
MSLSARIYRKLFISNTEGFQISPRHHVIFWLIYFTFNTLRWGSYYGDYLYSLKTNLLGFPIHMSLCYFTAYFLLPNFIYKKKFLSFTALLVSSIFVMVLAKFYFTYILINTNVWPEGPEITSTPTIDYMIVMMLGELYVISFFSAIKITIEWFNESKRAAKLEKMQSETELKFLRSQISPHFFFNTLNNVYSLSLEKSDKASDTVLKLSEFMRYLLYEAKDQKQSLEKEIGCIKNYLDLEGIRYGSSLKVQLNISGEPKGKKIAPMLLIPFIENAFKHGANKNIGPVHILIDIEIKEEFLNFKIENTSPSKNLPQKKEKDGGIGINNVKKRLELGYNKEDYNLNIFEKEGNHVVELKIILK